MFRTLILHKKLMVCALFVISFFFYGLDYILLGSAKELTIWFLGNLAFLPIYVIIVTLMIERVLKERERQAVMRKLNMVIGVFFSEVGSRLLKELFTYVVSSGEVKQHLLINGTWKDKDFSDAVEYLQKSNININSNCCNMLTLKRYLAEKRGFLVSLLENQNLLEHEEFTDLLWAVFHLVEELEARKTFESMPQSDIDHINGDIKRAFGHLSREWVLYMKHLKHDYPYLFSLAVRLNPMIDSPDPAVY
ncbi:MAG: hypothetical protein PHF56_02705 [Desulfuromonadaceae bacterium]|nr:hypothetical protein [Desulfuromonadaceae bacterium]